MSDIEPYLEAITSAEGRARTADREKQAAVTAARLAGISWTEIGGALAVSRQSARERYVCVEQLAKAWKRVESLLADLSRTRGLAGSSLQVVDWLVGEGRFSPEEEADVRLILDRYLAAMNGAPVSLHEADLLTGKVVPLAARLYLMVTEATDSGMADD